MSRRSDVRAAAQEQLAASIRVAELVKVVRFDAQAMTIDAQPLVQSEIDGAFANQPQLVDVPVATPCMGDFYIRPWYKPGDIGLLIICDKDIDSAFGGEVAEPGTGRCHDLTDTIFIGCAARSGGVPSGLPDNALVLGAGSTYVAIAPGGVTVHGGLTVDGIDVGSHTHNAPADGGTTSGPQ